MSNEFMMRLSSILQLAKAYIDWLIPCPVHRSEGDPEARCYCMWQDKLSDARNVLDKLVEDLRSD